jgi:hypothetical protein
MLLRCESLDPPMSQLGQNAKYSLRADVFRSTPKTGHRSMQSACPFRANRRQTLPPGRISHQHQHETFISTNCRGRGSLHRSLSVPNNPLEFAF